MQQLCLIQDKKAVPMHLISPVAVRLPVHSTGIMSDYSCVGTLLLLHVPVFIAM